MGLALLITLVGVAVCLLPLPFANDWQHQMSWKGIPWPWVWEHKGMYAPQISACIDEYCTLYPSVCIVRPFVCIVTVLDMRTNQIKIILVNARHCGVNLRKRHLFQSPTHGTRVPLCQLSSLNVKH